MIASSSRENETQAGFASRINRRARRLDALERLCKSDGSGRLPFSFLFKGACPPVYSYRLAVCVQRLPDILDADSRGIDFLLLDAAAHNEVLTAAGVLAAGAGLGHVVERGELARIRESHGPLAARVLLRPPVADYRDLPEPPLAYATGVESFCAFAARQAPAFNRWVEAICRKPSAQPRQIQETGALARSFEIALDQFDAWGAQ